MTATGQPPARHEDVLERGRAVFVSADIGSYAFESWVQKVENESNVRLDWHFMGGRAVVRALERHGHIQDVIKTMLDGHDKLQDEAARERRSESSGHYRWFPDVRDAEREKL